MAKIEITGLRSEANLSVAAACIVAASNTQVISKINKNMRERLKEHEKASKELNKQRRVRFESFKKQEDIQPADRTLARLFFSQFFLHFPSQRA